MSKNRNKHSKKGFKRNSIRPLLIQVFERNQGEQLTHKEICQVIDARDPNSRQNVFDELSMLVKHGSIERVNHFTFKSLQNSQGYSLQSAGKSWKKWIFVKNGPFL